MYNATSRTNWFTPRDLAGFVFLMAQIPEVTTHLHPSMPGKVMLSADRSDDGTFPSNYTIHGVEVDAEFEDLVHPLLTDGEILVVISAGADKLRYVGGDASATDNTGKQVRVALNSIYDLAEAAFGRRPDVAEL